MFSTAMVKTPCKNMVRGISHAGLGRPDYSLALKQHKDYIIALETCGLDVIVLDRDEDFPDSTFIEDTCLITPSCAVITNPGAPSRKGEIFSVKKAVRELDLPLERICPPATLDAGDVMMAGNHYFVGLSDRTNREGISQLGSILNKYKIKVSPIPLTSVLHLKTGISYLENNTVLAWGEFLTKPEFAGFTRLAVTDKEAYAANSVWINGYVIVPKGFEQTRNMVEAAGYKTIEVDVSEFRKLDGGLSCLSLRF